ncbi:MAG TPA: glycosyltransferase [Dongiaceae bacterium]|nr:glycosyltransferase [Dongiaceae bacterium]
MRLLCVLGAGPDHPSTRFRILQHLDRLRAGGVEADLLVAKRREGYDLVDLRRRARRADAVLIQKKLLARFKLAFLPGDRPILYDVDDAVFEISPDEERRFTAARAARRMRSRRARLAAVARRARVVIAGNRFLADWIAGLGVPVTIVPTGVDLAPFPADAVAAAATRRRARSGERLIGWIGSRPSLPYLAALAEPLRAVAAAVPGARLVQVCNDFIDLPGVPTEKRRWDAGTEARDLLDCDLGLMPIDDRPFSRGKCGLKILQYQAAGLPVVCSPVGANREIVRAGETGLFAEDGPGWTEAITRLLRDPEAAARCGAAGRARVERDYAAPVIADRLLAVLRDVVKSGDDGVPRQPDEGGGDAEGDERLLVADHLREGPALGSRARKRPE